VRFSLKWLVESRLGRAQLAITRTEGFVRDALATEIAEDLEVDTTALLLFEGVALADGGTRRVNRVQIVGVESSFWSFAQADDPFATDRDDRAAVNRHLAQRLGVDIGDDLVIRLERINQIPGDMPYRPRDRNTAAIRLSVADVVSDERFGRFSLRAQQVAPLTVFVPKLHLSRALGVENRCNVILVAARSGEQLEADEVKDSLAENWRLADADLSLRRLSHQNGYELLSSQVFLSSGSARAALAIETEAVGILTYFVNGISASDRSTPYSFVSSVNATGYPGVIGPDEIIVNDWLADDLGIDEGDSIEMYFFVPDEARNLEERTARFRVSGIVPMTGRAADASLIPDIPGFTDAERCTEWDTSLPIDLARVRNKDEAYWERFRGTPKAFVSLSSAQRLWASRYGELTAVRYSRSGKTIAQVEQAILEQLDPENVGLTVTPAMAEGLRAADDSVDFGQLFLGLSFFLIAGALSLTGLMFVLGIESRGQESGVLRALGFTPLEVSRLRLAEASLLASLGTVFGLAGGVLFAHATLWGLKTVWQGAVGSTVLRIHVSPPSLLIGATVAFMLANLILAFAQRRSSSQTVCELLRGAGSTRSVHKTTSSKAPAFLIAVSLIGAATIVLGVGPDAGQAATGAFWGAGTLMLFAMVSATDWWLVNRRGRLLEGVQSLRALAWAETARKRRRSAVTVALIACGVFIVVAVGANRKSTLTDSKLRSSGTGGFAFYGETALSVEPDLNSPISKRRLGLPSDGLQFVQLRRRDGDDASCLNLNRTSRPTLLGVPFEEFATRKAFSFATISPEIDPSDPWRSLEIDLPAGAVPAVADQTVISWGLGLAVGDLIPVTDEHGNRVNLLLVGGLRSSVFQGYLLISESAFKDLFPSASGSHVFLIDTPDGPHEETHAVLSSSLGDWGLELQTATDRLASFLVVENTYLGIFLALGGLGLVLGTAGVGVIVLRDVLGRRAELAVLRAIGFRHEVVVRLLTLEYGTLVMAGILSGTVAALVAALPSIRAAGSGIPWSFLGLVLASIVTSGLVSVRFSAVLAARGKLTAALRNE
jgi:putative ABC transport system permease protein